MAAPAGTSHSRPAERSGGSAPIPVIPDPVDRSWKLPFVQESPTNKIGGKRPVRLPGSDGLSGRSLGRCLLGQLRATSVIRREFQRFGHSSEVMTLVEELLNLYQSAKDCRSTLHVWIRK